MSLSDLRLQLDKCQCQIPNAYEGNMTQIKIRLFPFAVAFMYRGIPKGSVLYEEVSLSVLKPLWLVILFKLSTSCQLNTTDHSAIELT